MTRSRRTTSKLLIGTMVAFSSIAIAACCKSGTDDDIEPITSAEPITTPEPVVSAEPPPTLETPDPEWKKKCPDADRPETGTVTALRTLQIYKTPDNTSEKLESISRGTWVNLLGAKGTWWCIDYPCGVGQLCPGWVEERYTRRKVRVVDAGIPDVVVKDTSIPDVAVKDVAKKDTGKFRPRIILKLRDAGMKKK